MGPPRPDRVALVDVGSDSTRLLVAEPAGTGIREIERRAVVTRLAEGTAASGRLSPPAMRRTQEAIGAFALARRADERHAFLTSAVREAEMGSAFAVGLAERFGLIAHVLSSAEEADLTYRGAVHRAPVEGTAVVIDIGGGSCEIVVAGHEGPLLACSAPIGVVRHSERHLSHDPPAADHVSALSADVHRLMRATVPEPLRGYPQRAIAVASAESWLAATGSLLALAPVTGSPPHLTVAVLERGLEQLGRMSTQQIERAPGLLSGRGRSLVAGCAILLGFLRTFGLDEVALSPGDLLTGAALAWAGDPSRA